MPWVTTPKHKITLAIPGPSGLVNSIPLFIGANVSGIFELPLFISGSGDGNINSTLASGLFISGPPVGLVGSGLSPGLATLFMPAVSGYGPSQDPGTAGILPLFVGESGVATIYNTDSTPIQSGVIPLVVTGVSNMYPKEWFWNRSAVRDSSGYVPIEKGITIFINGE